MVSPVKVGKNGLSLRRLNPSTVDFSGYKAEMECKYWK